MEFKQAYVVYPRSQSHPVGESRAKQSMAAETDINNIMAKYKKTGLVTHVSKYQGQYGEFNQIDFHEAMNAIREAEEMFMTLPADVRRKFENDAGAFLDYVDNPENEAGMRELGLLPPKKLEVPAEEPVPETPVTPA